MASGFALAVDAMFEDPVLGLDALFRRGGEGAAIPVRVIRRAPDRLSAFNDGRMLTDTIFIDVRRSEVECVQSGDTFEIDGEIFEVRGDPARDSERLIFQCEAREL